MTDHRLKAWPAYFHAVISGAKRFELRRNDRDFKVGDTLTLAEYDPAFGQYSGKTVRANVTYIMRDADSGQVSPGFCLMSIDVKKEEEHSCGRDTYCGACGDCVYCYAEDECGYGGRHSIAIPQRD